MVRTLRAAAGSLACMLLLSACQLAGIFLSTPFSSTLSLVTAQRDFSSQIPADAADTYKLAVLETSGGTCVILSSSQPSAGPSIVFMDAGLADLRTPCSYADVLGTAFDAAGAMVDIAADIRIGPRRFDPATRADTTPFPTPVLPKVEGYSRDKTGAEGLVTASTNITQWDLDSSANTIRYQRYDSAWAPLGQATVSVSGSSGVRYFLDSVFPDAAGSVIWVVGEDTYNGGNQTIHVVKTPGANVAGATLGPLLDTYSPWSRSTLKAGTFGYGGGSLFAYDRSMRGFVRLDPATGDVTGFFSCPSEPDRVTYAYTPSGGSFYSFDKKSRKLARYAAWW